MVCLGPHEAELSTRTRARPETSRRRRSNSRYALTVHAGDPTKIELCLPSLNGEDVTVVKELVGYALLQNQRVGVRVRQIDVQQDVLVTLTLAQT